VCGIAGIVGLGRTLDEQDCATGRRMTDLLDHRGPDSKGWLADEHCFLGNTRLSVIDLSDQASLPMKTDDDRVWLAYNGEITNFRNLERRHSLRERCRFHSTSDTEVLLHLYSEMGGGCLNELSGMFAFCAYDRGRGEVLLARDFFGTRPLFWMVLDGKLYFASEIKSFMAVPGFTPALHEEAVFHYFSLAYVPGTMTPFRGVHELDGAEMIRIDPSSPPGEVRPERYYDLRFRPDPRMTLEEAEEGFYGALLDAVDRNLISDVPVGLTLSGGLDSSSVLGLSKVLGRSTEIHTFSLRINERSFDESYYQRAMASYAGSVHHEITVDQSDIPGAVMSHVAYMDEPIGDGSAIPFMLLAREAKRHVKVLLSGEGGDEVSNAYETHMANHVGRMYRRFVPPPVRGAARWLAHRLPVSYRKLSFDFLARRFTDGAEMSPPVAHMYYRHVLGREEKLTLMPGSGAFTPTGEIFRRFYESLDYPSELDRLAHMDMVYFFIGDLMMKNDRMLNASSVEARFPFMDREAVEFFVTIPASFKIRRFTRRYIEKRAMKRVLPGEVYRRQNFGIELPYSYWFRQELRPMAEKWFTRERAGRTGILDPAVVERLWDEHLSGRRDNGRILWCILTLLIWFEIFVFDGNFRDYLFQPGP
jgi:asparagine synthase (glutamine-hydrolysing)